MHINIDTITAFLAGILIGWVVAYIIVAIETWEDEKYPYKRNWDSDYDE